MCQAFGQRSIRAIIKLKFFFLASHFFFYKVVFIMLFFIQYVALYTFFCFFCFCCFLITTSFTYHLFTASPYKLSINPSIKVKIPNEVLNYFIALNSLINSLDICSEELIFTATLPLSLSLSAMNFFKYSCCFSVNLYHSRDVLLFFCI